MACYAVAATTTTVSHSAGPLQSVRRALSLHESPERCLAFAPQNQWIAQGMNHLKLLSRPEVARQLMCWLGSDPQVNSA